MILLISNFLQLASSNENESDIKINLNINVNGLEKGNVEPGNPVIWYRTGM